MSIANAGGGSCAERFCETKLPIKTIITNTPDSFSLSQLPRLFRYAAQPPLLS